MKIRSIIYILSLVSVCIFQGCGLDSNARSVSENRPQNNQDMLPKKTDIQSTPTATQQKTSTGAKNSDDSEKVVLLNKAPNYIRGILGETLSGSNEPDKVKLGIRMRDLDENGIPETLVSVINDGEGKDLDPNGRPLYIFTQSAENKDIELLVTPFALYSKGLKFISKGKSRLADVQYVRVGPKLSENGEAVSQTTDYIDTFKMFDGQYWWCGRKELDTGKDVETKFFEQDFINEAPPKGKSCPAD